MILSQDSLQKLAEAYLHFLIWQEDSEINKYLSLNFMRRQRVTSQIKLSRQLPKFIFGFGLEACLRDKYDLTQNGNETLITPFQFDITYSLQMNLIESERTTITLHSLVLEDGEWKFDAIVTQDDIQVLQNIVNKIRKREAEVALPAEI